MRIAYLDCASGISGDMTLGALVDVGVDLAAIQAGIDSLGLPSCKLMAEEVTRHGFRATNVTVQHEPEHAHRHLHHITDMIDGSRLSEAQKELAKRIFTRLGEAEAKVHGTTIRKVHFHEVGAVDSIADIVGSAIGWDLLNVDHIACSPIPTGYGFIQIAHGRTSIPAPATAELLQGVPLSDCAVECELTTPTGAAIATTLASEFGRIPDMTIQQIGYGAGDRDLEQQGNVLRLLVGETSDKQLSDRVMVLETNLDDVSSEIIGYAVDRLLQAGALDVYTTSIHMKKNRPGVTLTVLCAPDDAPALESIVFQETTTLGVRRWMADRHKLAREPHAVDTPWGKVTGKKSTLPNGTILFSPEYESCRELSLQHKVALQEVMATAREAFRK